MRFGLVSPCDCADCGTRACCASLPPIGGRVLRLVTPAFVACSDAPTAPTRMEPVDPGGRSGESGGTFVRGNCVHLAEHDPRNRTRRRCGRRVRRSRRAGDLRRREDARVTVNAYLFDVGRAWGAVEFQVNPEFGSRAGGARRGRRVRSGARPAAPAFLMTDARAVQVNAGGELFGRKREREHPDPHGAGPLRLPGVGILPRSGARLPLTRRTHPQREDVRLRCRPRDTAGESMRRWTNRYSCRFRWAWCNRSSSRTLSYGGAHKTEVSPSALAPREDRECDDPKSSRSFFWRLPCSRLAPCW